MIYDDQNDARFVIRSVHSAGNDPDIITEVFSVDNGNVAMSGNLSVNGNVGIGITTPRVKLDLGNTGDIALHRENGKIQWWGDTSTTYPRVYIESNSSNHLLFGSDTTEWMRIKGWLCRNWNE